MLLNSAVVASAAGHLVHPSAHSQHQVLLVALVQVQA
jgi:translation initiation factor 6 (eIF-6)